MELKSKSKKRPFDKTPAPPSKPNRRHRKHNNGQEYDDPDESKPHSKPQSHQNQKVVFDDDGNTLEAGSQAAKAAAAARHQSRNGGDVDTKWFQVYAAYNTHGELVEMKDAELAELTNTCRQCFDAELASLQKRKRRS